MSSELAAEDSLAWHDWNGNAFMLHTILGQMPQDTGAWISKQQWGQYNSLRMMPPRGKSSTQTQIEDDSKYPKCQVLEVFHILCEHVHPVGLYHQFDCPGPPVSDMRCTNIGQEGHVLKLLTVCPCKTKTYIVKGIGDTFADTTFVRWMARRAPTNSETNQDTGISYSK
jgi:hypothetical protein